MAFKRRTAPTSTGVTARSLMDQHIAMRDEHNDNADQQSSTSVRAISSPGSRDLGPSKPSPTFRSVNVPNPTASSVHGSGTSGESTLGERATETSRGVEESPVGDGDRKGPKNAFSSTVSIAVGDDGSSTSTGKPVSGMDVGQGSAAQASGRNYIVVHPHQRGNPVLEHVRNVPWQFGDIVPDYSLGTGACALFLSIKYHAHCPTYIHTRIQELGRGFSVRILLVLVDQRNSSEALVELSKLAVVKELTLIVAWSNAEAGRYLETFKVYEHKPPDMLKADYLGQLREVLTSAKKVNKSDTITLVSTFGSLHDIMEASVDELQYCPGFGEQKAQRLHDIFRTPFFTHARGTSGTTKFESRVPTSKAVSVVDDEEDD